MRARPFATAACLSLVSIALSAVAPSGSTAETRSAHPMAARIAAYAQGERPLRVLLSGNADRVRVLCDGPVSVRNEASGSTILSSETRDVVCSVSGDSAAPVRLEVGSAGEAQAVSLRGRKYAVLPQGAAPLRVRAADKAGNVLLEATYPGGVRAEPNGDGGLRILNLVPIDTYLLGVLGPEMGAGAPMEALKAQAVAARSYAIWQAVSRADAGHDLRTDTSDQVYRGGAASERVSEAVGATRGQVLLIDGQVCRASYHACCGGTTCTAPEVWGGDVPGLAAVFDGKGSLGALAREADARRFLLEPPRDVFCRAHARFRWRERYTPEQLAANLNASAGRVAIEGSTRIGVLRDVRVDARSPSGRVLSITFVGSAGSATVRGDAIRLALGTGAIGGEGAPSTFLAIAKAGSAPPYSAYEVFGGGWGHGAGMCQAGAMGMAEAGYAHSEILKHYYGGCELAGTP